VIRPAARADRRDSSGSSRRPAVALLDTGQPLVVWTEIEGDATDIRAAWFNPVLNGGQGGWEALGASLDIGGISTTGSADHPIVLMAGATPVVAWLDDSSGVAQVYAKQFNGTTWVEIGTGSASGSGVSDAASDVAELALTTDGTRIAAVWAQPNGTATQIHVSEYDAGTWTLVSAVDGLGTPTFDSTAPSAAYHDGALFVAWEQVIPSAGFDSEIHVARYDGTWAAAGVGALTDGGVSDSQGAASGPQLASGGGTLYLAWADTQITEGLERQTALYTKVWDGSAFTEELPGDGTDAGIARTASETIDLALSVDASGHPFVAWQETGSGTSDILLRGNTFDIDRVFAADGLTSVQTILDSTDLGPGDVILVQSGSDGGGFTLTGDDAGVTIYGAPGAAITGSVTVASAAADVVIQRLQIDGDLSVDDADGFTLRQSTINGDVSLRGGVGALLSENTIHGVAAGLEMLGATVMTVFMAATWPWGPQAPSPTTTTRP